MSGAADETALFDSLAAPNARAMAIAGVESFAEKGFHGTTTRDIADRVGLSPASVYSHFSSKAELLYTISKVGHEGALQTLEAAAESESAPVERVAAMVSDFAAWHARNHRLARVVQYELGAIPADRRPELYDIRQRFRGIFETALEEGEAARSFVLPDVSGAALAILSLCIDVARWYSPDGERSPEDIGELYAELMLRMLGAPPSN